MSAASANIPAAGPALLYMGAAADVFPLTCPELRRLYPHIIYCEVESRLQDWIRNCGIGFEMGLMAKLSLSGGYDVGIGLPDSYHKESDCVWTATLTDGTRFTYYMNCDDASKLPPSVRDQVKALFFCYGYLPPVNTLDVLPNAGVVHWKMPPGQRGGPTFETCPISSKQNKNKNENKNENKNKNKNKNKKNKH